MRVSIVGTGNAASALGKLLRLLGHNIVEVTGRNEQKVISLSAMLRAKPTKTINELGNNSDVYLICVSDDAIENVTSSIGKKDGVVVHVSGTMQLEAINKKHDNSGVAWPIQSLTENNFDPQAIPIAIEGNTRHSITVLKNLFNGNKGGIFECNGSERRKLHLSAVFISNFTNHLYKLAYDYCLDSHIDFKALLPLLRSTALRQDGRNPILFQTGPAVRKDMGTMEIHKVLLAKNSNLLSIYSLISESITKKKGVS